jgi:uncharacterized membrane protein YfcA
MILEVPLEHLALLAFVAFVGAAVQGVAGLGIGLLLAPVAGVIEPSLLPGLPLWLAAAMPLLTLTRDVQHVEWKALAWALPARVPGTAVGVAVVGMASADQIGVFVGVTVLLAVALTVNTIEIKVSPTSLAGAGFVSGVTGTATSIGGPPLAILLQKWPASQTRGTLGAYFLAGAGFSLAGLFVSGQLAARDLDVALMLLPAVALGFLASLVLRHRVPVAYMRAVLLAVCAASALLLVIRSIT